jgi:hypothetical protein
VETNSTGGQGPRRSLAPSDDDDDDFLTRTLTGPEKISVQFEEQLLYLSSG